MYRVVLSPFLAVIAPELLSRMKSFVESGGTWILTPFCGIRDQHATESKSNALGPAGSWCAVIDYAGNGGKAHLPQEGTDLFTTEKVGKKIELELWGVRLVRFE